MLIMNQWKDKIINIENVIDIGASYCIDSDKEDGDGKFIVSVTYYVVSNKRDLYFENLGIYDTEEMANKVLRDILERYGNYEKPIYYMPENNYAKFVGASCPFAE